MIKGTVKWFSPKKGYGIITPDDGCEDIFVHYSSIHATGSPSLIEGESVEFEITEGAAGKNAVEVAKVDSDHTVCYLK